MQSEEFAGKVYELSDSPLSVGRLPENDVSIEHNSVSGQHARLVKESDDYVVKDLDSTNGTRVNGERITEQKLRRHDIVRFGNIEVLYDSEFSPSTQALPEPSPAVSLENVSSKGRPAFFFNASPVKEPKDPTSSAWSAGFIALWAAAVGLFAFFAYTAYVIVPGML